MTREEIINNIRKDGLNIGKNDVLISIMPTQIQSIALAYHRYENYVPDFLVTSLLSAAATAIGNSFRLRIKGLWTTNPALYIVLFGKPGLGKTPPIEAARLTKRDFANIWMKRNYMILHQKKERRLLKSLC